MARILLISTLLLHMSAAAPIDSTTDHIIRWDAVEGNPNVYQPNPELVPTKIFLSKTTPNPAPAALTANSFRGLMNFEPVECGTPLFAVDATICAYV